MLELRRVWKRYGALTAVRNISFAIRPGEVLGYLGPNGSGKSTTVKMLVGVMPPTFGFPLDVRSPVEVWRPLAVTSSRYSSGHGLSRYFRLVGRLQPDGSSERARAGLDSASGALRAAFPDSADDWPPRLVPLYDSLVGDVRGWMLLVLIAVTLVMLVACANAANLLLVRASVRAREMSLRAALR